MVLTGQAVHRIVKDVKYIMKNPINNIHYKHDTENITSGYALIIGNRDTPYSYGNYLFEFTFPDNYPYEPPKVRILTSDGNMRFHPNLYIGGKVCLSIINTWHGEGWTSCNNINSILLTLSSILDNNSLTFEPGICNSHHNVKKYDILVGYKNIEHCIIKQINTLNDLAKNNTDHDTNNPKLYKTENCLLLFKNEIIDNFKKNFNIINNDLQNLKDRFNKIEINGNCSIFISSYALQGIIDFDNLEELLMTLSITTGFNSLTINNENI
jgi:ubiquitin-protein ligase